jgi:hypothetical protein
MAGLHTYMHTTALERVKAKKDEITQHWSELHNEEFHNL